MNRNLSEAIRYFTKKVFLTNVDQYRFSYQKIKIVSMHYKTMHYKKKFDGTVSFRSHVLFSKKY